MNQIQKLSQKILTDRLKLQLGLALDADVDYFTLKAMNHQAQLEREREQIRSQEFWLAAANY